MSKQSDKAPGEPDRVPVTIRQITTGVSGLDQVLGGGIPEFSFNIIAGAPGTGKTTLAQQIMFANATPSRPAIHFTVLGEPTLKMLRYQQQFGFFDTSRVGRDIHFLNLAEEVLQRDLDSVYQRISTEIERLNPAIVVVDSFRTAIRTVEVGHNEMELQHFIQRLALRLTSYEATSFLIGEYSEAESRSPVFTVADGIIWLSNDVERNATLRKLRVNKVRGQAPLSGLHTFRITSGGLEVFPRQPISTGSERRGIGAARQSTGIAELDAMMDGGIPAGDSVLISGPTGAGKSILASHFVAAGAARDQCAVIAVFEEHPNTYIARAAELGFDFEGMIARGKLDIMYLRPLDLSVDETLHEIEERVMRIGASRVVIDSLSGFEVALAPSFRQDFRESFYRLTQALTALNVTVISTMETSGETEYLRFSPYNISFLSDDIVAMRYVELNGKLETILGVIKMRGSSHSRELRLTAITQHGVELRDGLAGYRGIITGVPEPRRELGGSEPRSALELSSVESALLETLLRLGESTEASLIAENGLTLEQITSGLDRLVRARFVSAVGVGGQTAYRAVLGHAF